MPYCAKCGKEIPANAGFCPSCGAQIGVQSSSAFQSTEFDRLIKDKTVQEHWLGRLIAFVIDLVAYSIVYAIIFYGIIGLSLGSIYGLNFGSFNATIGASFLGFGLLYWGLFVLYGTFAEGSYGRTLGKSIMHMHVVTVNGTQPDFGKTFLRSVTKINPALLFLDILGGLFTRTKPGQKFTDHLAETVVIRE